MRFAKFFGSASRRMMPGFVPRTEEMPAYNFLRFGFRYDRPASVAAVLPGAAASVV